MAAIVKIEARGLRGVDFVHDVHQLQVIRGDIGSHKTSVADAIRFAALGYVPRLGKTLEMTSRMMRGREMTVVVALDDGRTIRRTLEHHRGRLRQRVGASWVDPKATNTEHADAVLALFGTDRREVEENLDIRHLLDASPNERAKRLEEILDASGVPAETMVGWTRALATARLTGREDGAVWDVADSGDLDGATARWAEDFRPGIQDALTGAMTLASETLHQHGLPRSLQAAGRARTEAHGRGAQRRAARAEIEERVHEAGVPKGTVKDLKERRQAVTDRAAVLNDTLTRAGKAGERANAARRRLLQAQQDAHGLEAVHARTLELEASLLRLVVPEVAPLETVPFVEPPNLEALMRDVEALKEAIPPAPETPMRLPEPQPATWEERLRSDTEALARAERDPWTDVAALAAKLAGVDHPVARDVAEALAIFVSANAPNLAQLRQNVSRAQQALDQCRAAHVEWLAQESAGMAAYQTALAERQGAVQTYDAAVEVFRVASHKARAAHDVLLAESAAAHNRHMAEAEAVRAKRREAEAEIATLRARANEVTAELEQAQALHDAAHDEAIDTAAVMDEMATLDEENDRLEMQIAAVQAAGVRQVEMEMLAEEAAQADAEVEAYAAVEWGLQRLRERDLGARGEPILERMRIFLEAAGRSEQPFFRAEGRQVDFGWIRGERTIHVASLSGGETVLFTAALACALTGLRAPPCRVLLLEGAEAGPVTGSLLDGLRAASGDLDNALLTTWVEVGDQDLGVSVIDLDCEVAPR